MGCLESRQGMNRVEYAITTVEKHLGFFRVPIQTIDSTINRYSIGGKVSKHGLEEIGKHLKINLDGIDDVKSKVSRFYS
jgi:hypothetical protein